MATKKSGEIARGADVPLALANAGPRDALLDPRPGDYVPDLDTKGLHVGEVRQPAEPVLMRGGAVEFESKSDQPSKFAASTYAAQLAANEAWEAKQGDLYAGRLHEPIATDQDAIDARVATLQKAPATVRSSRTGSGSAGKLEADAADVAASQAAEDSK